MEIVDIMDPQQQAIETIDKNLAVSAGAGTGKTKVLTERYIYILEHGKLEEFKAIESIVAITFTNKATQEMIERIRKEIKKNFSKGPKWRRFYRDLERANISTIHGFCSKILRENPIEANIDPYFEVLDDNISSKLLKESIFHVLSTNLEKNDDVFKMMQVFKQNRIENIVGDFSQIYNNIRTVGMSFKEVMDNTLKYIGSLEIKEEFIEEIKDILIYLMENLSKRSKIYKLKSDPLWENFRNNNYKKEDIFTYIEYIQDNLGSSSKELEKQDRLKELLNSILLVKEKENLWLYKTVLNLLMEIDERYKNLKREVGGLDYDDLQILVLELLDNEEVKKKYQEKFKYFMIDEFQDTNELQKKIFYKLASIDAPLDRENLFIVGDPKQSIYGFRGADIEVFYDVIHDIKTYGEDNIITLKKNYRSIDTILEFVNNIFVNLMGEKYDGLIANRASKNDIDVEIIENPNLEKVEGIDNSTLANIYEAETIAKRIKKLVNNNKYKYGDFALLFRSTTRNYIYEKALKDYNIPYFNSSGKRYFYRQEVIDLINALKAISNPYDNIATIGFLRSPMIGLRDDTIYLLLRNKEENLYKTMIIFQDNPIILDNEKDKIQEAIEIIDYFIDIKDLYGISNIVQELVEKTLFIETLLLKADGEQSIANVYKFLELTRAYDGENSPSLEDYIDYLEDIRLGSEGEGIIKSEDDNVVNIMTIHGSKGLQFPVVIIPEMARDIRGYTPNILFNKDLSIGIKTEDNRALYDALKKDYDYKDKEETKRVLYVAMTRAKELLILGNQGNNRGFKGLIKELLDDNQYKVITDIELPKEKTKLVKSIDKELFIHNKDYEKISTPLLYPLEEYGKKSFNRYNISQYLIFNQCKRRFFMDYYWEINLNLNLDPSINEGESSILSGIDRGNIVHNFCNLYRQGMDKEKLIKNILNSYGIIYGKDIEVELRPYIDNYISYYSEDYDTMYSEKSFHIKIGDGYLKGIIDRIVIKDDKIEILDFKTNRLWNRGQLVEYYKPQLQLYAYALEKIIGKKVDKASILFLERGIKESIDISPKALKENMDNIIEFIKYIEENDIIEKYPSSSNCDQYCPHKEFCNLLY